MKKNFLAMLYSIRKFVHRKSKYLLLGVIIIWFLVSLIIGYNLWGMYQDLNMPNEEKYVAYETIIQQILDGEIEDVIMPKNTKIEMNKDELVIKNTCTYYSVTKKITEEKARPIRAHSNNKCFFDKIYAGIWIGLIGIGLVGGFILCISLRILCFIFRLFKDISKELWIEYRYRKIELEKKENAKLEKSESEDDCE